jgi:phosphohistidine phosphatase SixA
MSRPFIREPGLIRRWQSGDLRPAFFAYPITNASVRPWSAKESIAWWRKKKDKRVEAFHKENPMKRIIWWLTAVLTCWSLPGAYAQTVDMKALVAQMKQGGHVIVFRHGATHRDQADTDPLNLDNVAKQRLLNGSGREVAKQVGNSFRKLGIPLGKVYTSRFNRAVETGKLVGGGEVTSTIDITEGGLVISPIENDRRAEAFRKLVGTMPEPGKNTLIITHKPNIMDAFGKDWFDVREGEAAVFRPDGSGKTVLVARVQAIDWINAAAAPSGSGD